VRGARKFLGRIWHLVLECQNNSVSDKTLLRAVHKLNQKISDDTEQLKFNTALAAYMEFLNVAEADKAGVGRDIIERMLLILAPFAPHICEELWQILGHSESIFKEFWPVADAGLIKEDTIDLIIQVNGKLRAKIKVPADILQEQAIELALSLPEIKNGSIISQSKNNLYSRPPSELCDIKRNF